LFVVDYSRINVVKHTLTGATFHSNVSRPRLYQQLLRRKGDWLYILELQGFIFFGTAQRILDMARQRIDNRDLPPVRFLVLDFRSVNGFDSSALFGFAKMKQLTKTRGITLAFTNLSPKMQRQMKKEILREGEKDSIQVSPDLDHGIEWCEDHMIASLESLDFGSTPSTLMKQLEKAMPSSVSAAQLMTYFEEKKSRTRRIYHPPGRRFGPIFHRDRTGDGSTGEWGWQNYPAAHHAIRYRGGRIGIVPGPESLRIGNRR
jgi:SulP family sulfate permease